MNKYLRLIAFFAVLALVCLSANAQVKTKIFDEGMPSALIPASEVQRSQKVIAEPAELSRLKAQRDAEISTDYKYRFALPVNVDIDVLATAKITELNDSIIYALTIQAKNARNLSLQFNEFNLSPGAILSLFTRHELTDSITASQNNQNRVWATRVYQGNTIVVVLKIPKRDKGLSSLRINTVNFGYKRFGQEFGNPGVSQGCNINVVCPQGNGWGK